jgi:hypothetical protein
MLSSIERNYQCAFFHLSLTLREVCKRDKKTNMLDIEREAEQDDKQDIMGEITRRQERAKRDNYEAND